MQGIRKKRKRQGKYLFFCQLHKRNVRHHQIKTALSFIGCSLTSKRSKSTKVHFYFHSHWLITFQPINRGMLLFKADLLFT